jgi:thymidylate synthase (FAD)
VDKQRLRVQRTPQAPTTSRTEPTGQAAATRDLLIISQLADTAVRRLAGRVRSRGPEAELETELPVQFAEPEVYLISRPSVDWDALESYLSSVDEKAANWLHERRTVSAQDGETLTEAAHRACTRYWASPPDPDITKNNRISYLQMIMRGDFARALEHASYTFALQNVSHATADALERRRAGTVSRQSRSTRLADEIPFWLPSWAREDPVLVEAVESHLAGEEEFQQWMLQHINFHDPAKSWHTKKNRAAFMQRFLPKDATTDVIWTANISALRSIEAPEEEEETRVVFSKVKQIMKTECPVLFSDVHAWPTDP